MVEPGSTNASHFLVYYAKNPFGSVKLQPGKISGTVSMTATSGNAGPVKDITVIVQDASGTKMIKTDKNGRFEFSNVVPGPVFVSIDVPELTSTVDGDKHAIYVEPGRSYTSDFGINKLGLNVDQ